MKTVEQIALENGANGYNYDADLGHNEGYEITYDQLTATIEAWNRQNSEPIYQILNTKEGWLDSTKEEYANHKKGKRIVYLEPPQPQTVRDGLKQASKICEELSDSDVNDGEFTGIRMCEVAIDQAIRALIDQPAEPVVLNNMSNSPEHVANYIKQSMPNNSKEIIALMTSPNLDECVNRFLGWKLPSDFSPDCGISFEQYSNPNNDRYKALREPTGTNLFNADQAKAMFQHVLKGATTELAEQPPASQELGWLIEKNINGVLHYVYCSEIGLLDWTNDNLKAMRFSRKQDADQLTNLMEDAERVAEHIWMG